MQKTNIKHITKITMLFILLLIINIPITGCHVRIKTQETPNSNPIQTIQNVYETIYTTNNIQKTTHIKQKINQTEIILTVHPKPTTTTTVTTTTTLKTTVKTTKPTTTVKTIKPTTKTQTTCPKTTTDSKTDTTTVSSPVITTVTTTKPEDTSAYNTNFENEVLRLTNIERAKEGLCALTMNESLRKSARIRAKESSISFSHTRPDNTPWHTAITIKYCHAGENLAAGQQSPERVVTAWVESPDHRKNLMNPKYKQLGVGCYQNADTLYKTYWAQLFFTP